MNILDVTVVENDTLSLQNAFRSWFHDSGTDSEHLHLILPTPSLPHTQTKGREKDVDEYDEDWESVSDSLGVINSLGRGREKRRELILKCDIQERIIDPLTAFDTKIGDQFVSGQLYQYSIYTISFFLPWTNHENSLDFS